MRSMTTSQRRRRALFALPAAATLVACVTTRGPELEPRYVALHNAFAAMGLAQVGPLQQGSLAEGRETRLNIELGSQCTTLVAMGGQGVRDLDVTLLDPAGKPVAHDTTSEPQAVVRACVETAGTYTLLVKMKAGAGDFVAATWTGGVGPGGGGGGNANTATASLQVGAGTCESPIPVVAGTYNGSTARGDSENEGSCATSSSRELVYRLEVATRQRVVVEVDPRFDAVLYMRKGECSDSDSEVACNDDVAHGHSSKLDEVLDPGTYFVFVDGYQNEGGSYKMNIAMNDVPSLAEVCRQSRALPIGPPVNGSTSTAYDHAQASCGENAKGPDTLYKLDIAQRSRARITLHSDDFAPVVHVRKVCTDEASEVGCADSSTVDEEATFVGLLDPATYAVFADSSDHDADGRYQLTAELAPEQGSGTPGDGCGDAVPLPSTETTVSGDTFLARDDVAGRCGGAGGPDVVYRVELTKRSRVTAAMSGEEGKHLFVMTKTCADKGTEVACGESIDQVLAPGVYYLAVDGATPDAMGKFEFDYHVRDIGSQEAACRTVPTLVDGQTVTGTTAGGSDKFSTSCAGREDAQASPDRVYRFTVATRARVRLTLATNSWDGVLAVRRACLDGNGGPASEISCNNDADDTHHARIENAFDPGTYYVVVDGHASGNEGPFTLEYKVIR
jgi:hypothetical protein